MRLFGIFLLAVTFVTMSTTKSLYAARVVLSTSATDPTADLSSIPEVNLNAGDSVDLYVWVLSLSNAAESFNTLGFSVTTDNTNVSATAAAVNNAISIPGGVDFLGNPLPDTLRWSGVFDPSLNQLNDRNGHNFLTKDSKAICVLDCGGTSLANAGTDQERAIVTFPGDSVVSVAYLHSSISLQADSAGTAQLVLRTGESLYATSEEDVQVPMQYGLGSDLVPLDDLGNTFPSTDGTSNGIHAIINVTGGGGIFERDGTNPADNNIPLTNNNQDFDSSPAGVRPDGRLLIDNSQIVVDSFFDVFFDISCGGGVCTPTELQAIADAINNEGSGVATPGDNGIHGNLQVQFDASTNADVIAYNFGAGNNVNSVAVPEPSTIVMALLGLIGLVGLRRRRNK